MFSQYSFLKMKSIKKQQHIFKVDFIDSFFLHSFISNRRRCFHGAFWKTQSDFNSSVDFVALTALSSARGLLSFLHCSIRHQIGGLCWGGRRETGLFCEAPRWLAKQTQRKVWLSLWETENSPRERRKNFVTTPRSLSPSVCLCRCHNRVLFLTNESAGGGEGGLAENVYIQHVSAAGCCFHG